MRHAYRLQAARNRPCRDGAAIGGIESDNSRARAAVRRLLEAVRQHEILALDQHSHQQRDKQRQHQRHFDDGGTALLACQGKSGRDGLAGMSRALKGRCHAGQQADQNESGVENARRRPYVLCMDLA